MKFILWDPKDGFFHPRSSRSSGVLGKIGPDNVYLTAYANYPDEKRPKDLEVGESILNVKFSLSGTTGHYDIHRIG